MDCDLWTIVVAGWAFLVAVAESNRGCFWWVVRIEIIRCGCLCLVPSCVLQMRSTEVCVTFVFLSVACAACTLDAFQLS